MGIVTANAELTIQSPAPRVLEALADYANVRPQILPDAYTDYAVQAGGVGAGTVVTWRLHATKKRIRHVIADVTVSADTVTETDQNSTLVTVFRVSPTGDSSATVTATTTWNGASGIGGFFEKTFAPAGLARIHAQLLANLAAYLDAAV